MKNLSEKKNQFEEQIILLITICTFSSPGLNQYPSTMSVCPQADLPGGTKHS